MARPSWSLRREPLAPARGWVGWASSVGVGLLPATRVCSPRWGLSRGRSPCSYPSPVLVAPWGLLRSGSSPLPSLCSARGSAFPPPFGRVCRYAPRQCGCARYARAGLFFGWRVVQLWVPAALASLGCHPRPRPSRGAPAPPRGRGLVFIGWVVPFVPLLASRGGCTYLPFSGRLRGHFGVWASPPPIKKVK